MIPAIAALFTAITCARLGVWQLHRYGESAAISARLLAAWDAPPVQRVDDAPVEELAFRQATLRGAWAPGTTAVVRGTPVAGEPGYQVITTFVAEDGARVLVDRGWVPTTTPPEGFAALDVADPATITGLLVPVEGNTALRPEPGPGGLLRWPLEMDLLWGMFPRAVGLPFAAMAASAEPPVSAVALRVGPRLEHEDERRLGPLPVPGYVLPLPQTHHLSYAAQWFAFAGMALVLWLWFSRASETAHE